MTTSDAMKLLADTLVQAGTKRAFGVPGGGPSLELIDALERRGVDVVTTAHEANAAVMAAAGARIGGGPGVAFAIKGPGLVNMLPGLAACSFESLPVLAVVEAYAPGTPAAKAHKRIDHARVVDGVAKAHRTWSVVGPDAAALLRHAREELPGAVVLDLPNGPAAEDAPLPLAVVAAGDRGAVAQHIARAQRPVVIAGTLALRMGASEHLAALSIPVLTTAAAKGVVDERLPHAAGVFTGVGKRLAPEARVLADADLVIGIGLRSREVLSAVPFACPLVTIDPLDDAAPGFAPVASCAALDDELCALLSARAWGVEVVAETRRAFTSELVHDAFLPAPALARMQAALPHARLVTDTGNFCTVAEHV